MKLIITSLLLCFIFGTSAKAARDNFNSIDGKNYYEFFEIPMDADQRKIKTAFRRLMRTYHPDYGEKNVRLSQEISAVNSVLSNPEKRRLYDLWLTTGFQGDESASGQQDYNSESEAIQRENELKKNVDYILSQAEKLRARYAASTLDQMAEHGRSHVIYVIRYMPDANYTTEELWKMIHEFGQRAYENDQITEDAFAVLAGGALQYLKERADYGGYADEKSYVRRMEAILSHKLSRLPHGNQTVWNTLWKILKEGQDFHPLQRSCATALNQVVRFTRNGVSYEIPITISIKFGN